MRSSPPSPESTYPLASRALRFRVIHGDESGFAVSQRVGIGGAIFKASIVPPVGSYVRLIERYATPGTECHVDAEVVAITPEPTLDGKDPGFCAVFRRFSARGDEVNLVDFLNQLEPGYYAPARRAAHLAKGDRIDDIDELGRGKCTRMTPAVPFSAAPLLRAAGVAVEEDAWDEGLEEIDLDGAMAGPTTPPPVVARHTTPLPVPTAPKEDSGPITQRRKRGITAILGGLFGRGRDDDK